MENYFIAFWAACAVVSFVLYVWAWTGDFDLDATDAVFFGLMSLIGPISLLAALIFAGVFLLARIDAPVLFRRRTK